MLKGGLINPDGSRLRFVMEDVIGMGTFGIVLRRGKHALKVAKLISLSGFSEEETAILESDNESNLACLEIEKDVYRRAAPFPGIAECIEISNEGILMAFYDRGNLEDYIKNNPAPDVAQQVQWIMSAISTVHHLHKCNILVDDIALRNMLLTEDLSIKMIDFGYCVLFPPELDLTTVADEHGLTIKGDIFHLGNLIYSIAAWEKFHFELYPHLRYERPPIDELPDLAPLLFGKLIQKCWIGAYGDMQQLQDDALRLCSGLDASDEGKDKTFAANVDCRRKSCDIDGPSSAIYTAHPIDTSGTSIAY
ncbi:MAG: hypothetical protein LQ337_007813 [Flavoplaca oasis]|nr:MAG: hypothetical protein LQ337_007813 [Flavoplaca oasis]